MLAQYRRYKAHVAPIYQSEIDRHLFATASFRGGKKSKSRSNWWSRLPCSGWAYSLAGGPRPGRRPCSAR